MEREIFSEECPVSNRRRARMAFLREAMRNPRAVGAIAPSGSALANAMVEAAGVTGERPLRVLEVGAGTGSVTRVLLEKLPYGSHLDIVETSPVFAAELRGMTMAHSFSVVHEMLVEEFPGDERYDAVVSGLPLTNFEPHQVERIMSRMLGLLRPGGVLTYFAYVGTRVARRLFSSAQESRRHREVDVVMQGYRDVYAAGHQRVWANLPPARVWQLELPVRPVVRGGAAHCVPSVR